MKIVALHNKVVDAKSSSALQVSMSDMLWFQQSS